MSSPLPLENTEKVKTQSLAINSVKTLRQDSLLNDVILEMGEGKYDDLG